MKVEIVRGVIYRAASLEAGRVYEVDQSFGEWLLARGKAVLHVEPIPALLQTPSTLIETKKRLRNR